MMTSIGIEDARSSQIWHDLACYSLLLHDTPTPGEWLDTITLIILI